MKKIYLTSFFRKLNTGLLFGLISNIASAGTSIGPVTVPLVLPKDGVVMFAAGSITQSQPSCSRVPSQPWVLDIRTDGGKAAYSMLLTAFSQGKNVTITGNNTCDLWGDRETVIYVLIN